MNISEILHHFAEPREIWEGAVTPPLQATSNFCFDTVDDMRNQLANEMSYPFYTRGYNPTVGVLREKLAALEGTEDALVFGSGSAAVAMAVMQVVKGGDHIVSVKKPYSWTTKLFDNYLSKYGVSTTYVDGTDAKNFERAIQPNTKLIYLESPNSMTFEMQDLEAVAKIAKAHGIVTACDNTYATPLFQQPHKLGIDLVIHSGTKYLNGHSDVVSGVVCGSKDMIQAMMKEEFMTLGGIIAPFNAWLMLRGLRTFEIRVQRSDASGRIVAKFLENHPKVKEVLYPFASSNPQRSLAEKQMSGAGGLMSIKLNTDDPKKAEAFSNALKYFLIAASWGGYESLQYPISAMLNSQNYNPSSLPEHLVRIYVGLEDPQMLIEDLSQALALL